MESNKHNRDLFNQKEYYNAANCDKSAWLPTNEKNKNVVQHSWAVGGALEQNVTSSRGELVLLSLSERVKLLLSSGSPADVSHENGFTPLHLAAAHGHSGWVAHTHLTRKKNPQRGNYESPIKMSYWCCVCVCQCVGQLSAITQLSVVW